MQTTIEVSTRATDDWVDVTAQVQQVIKQSKSIDGVATLFVPHTTAAITIQENADPPLKRDIDQALARIFPREGNYGHCEDNAASHMKAVLVGPSVQIPFAQGRLLLGQWQAIYLCEFDGPRTRQVHIHVS